MSWVGIEKQLDPSFSEPLLLWLVLAGGGGERFRQPGAASEPSVMPSAAGRAGPAGTSRRAEYRNSQEEGFGEVQTFLEGGGLQGVWAS